VVPLALLAKRKLQAVYALVPLRHKGATTILVGHLHLLALPHLLLLLRLLLQLVVRAEGVHIQLGTIRNTRPAEFAKREEGSRSQMMELDIESLQHPAKEGDVRKAKAAGEEVPKDHRISLLWFRNSLARWRDFYPGRRKT